MQVKVNGDNTTLHDSATLSDLLTHLGLGQGRVAVEVNREIIPRSEHTGHRLREGDHIEVVQAIGGG